MQGIPHTVQHYRLYPVHSNLVQASYKFALVKEEESCPSSPHSPQASYKFGLVEEEESCPGSPRGKTIEVTEDNAADVDRLPGIDSACALGGESMWV